jgi:hypothetical protein
MYFMSAYLLLVTIFQPIETYKRTEAAYSFHAHYEKFDQIFSEHRTYTINDFLYVRMKNGTGMAQSV